MIHEHDNVVVVSVIESSCIHIWVYPCHTVCWYLLHIMYALYYLQRAVEGIAGKKMHYFVQIQIYIVILHSITTYILFSIHNIHRG